MTDPTVTAAYHQDAITTVTLCSPDPLIEHPGVTVEVTWTLGRHDDALRALRAAVTRTCPPEAPPVDVEAIRYLPYRRSLAAALIYRRMERG